MIVMIIDVFWWLWLLHLLFYHDVDGYGDEGNEQSDADRTDEEKKKQTIYDCDDGDDDDDDDDDDDVDDDDEDADDDTTGYHFTLI